jgi:hypothetical protein
MNVRLSQNSGLLLISVVTLALVLCSCATGAHMEYYMGYLNKTGHSLYEVSVYSKNELWGFPAPLVVSGETTAGVITAPIPANAEVRILDHGRHKSVMVSIQDVPKDFQDGTIYFVFNRDGTVEAKALGKDDTAGHAELIKGLRPAGEYRFGFINRTGHELKAVTVFYNDQKVATGGDVLPRSRANFTYSDPLTTPCPAAAELRWEENGTPHAVKVKCDGVPKGFEGRIFFVIKADDTVEVHPVKKGDEKTAIELVK